MKILKFKTNINCEGCVAKVSPLLNGDTSIQQWEVDTKTADKILTVSGAALDEERIRQIVHKAGFIIKESM